MNQSTVFKTLSTAAVLAALTACASNTVPASISVAQALAAPDDSKVVITATLVQQLSDEHYLFRDSSGQVTVEIDDELLGEVKLAPDAPLRIFGVMDQDDNPAELEARTIQVVNQ